MQDILVSIVIANYNNGTFIDECLKSIALQDINCEIIIVDDASTDESIKVLEKAKSVVPFTLIKNASNRGVCSSRNRGILAATGDLICFLDSDDYLTRSSLKSRVKKIVKSENCIGSYGQIRTAGRNSEFNLNYHFTFATAKLKSKGFSDFRTSCGFNLHAPLVKRQAITDAGLLFDDDFSDGAEDWDFWYRLLEHNNGLFVPVQRTVGIYRQAPQSLRTKKMRKFLENKLKIVNRNPNTVERETATKRFLLEHDCLTLAKMYVDKCGISDPSLKVNSDHLQFLKSNSKMLTKRFFYGDRRKFEVFLSQCVNVKK